MSEWETSTRGRRFKLPRIQTVYFTIHHLSEGALHQTPSLRSSHTSPHSPLVLFYVLQQQHALGTFVSPPLPLSCGVGVRGGRRTEWRRILLEENHHHHHIHRNHHHQLQHQAIPRTPAATSASSPGLISRPLYSVSYYLSRSGLSREISPATERRLHNALQLLARFNKSRAGAV